MTRTLPEMRVWRVIPAALLLVAACNLNETVPTTAGPVPTSTTTVAAATTAPLVAGCPEGEPFHEGGEVIEALRGPSDADSLGTVSWSVGPSCETFTLEFVTAEGAPATTPPSIEVHYVENMPLIRMAIDADHTVITDQLVETPAVERLYVVTALAGGLFIDFHLAAPAQARVTLEDSPARVLLELQPGIVDYPSQVTISDTVVVVTPANGAETGQDIEVSGYTRTFESNVLVIATAGDEVVIEESTTGAGSLETWGEFRHQIRLASGEISLFVGSEDQEGGGLEGVTLNLSVQ